jgi:hypothetical protein
MGLFIEEILSGDSSRQRKALRNVKVGFVFLITLGCVRLPAFREKLDIEGLEDPNKKCKMN